METVSVHLMLLGPSGCPLPGMNCEPIEGAAGTMLISLILALLCTPLLTFFYTFVFAHSVSS